MSVINQMLKDLEERSPEHGHTSTVSVTPKKVATIKIVSLITLILVCLNVLGFYIWHLQTQVVQHEPQEQDAVNSIPNSIPNAVVKPVAKSVKVEQEIEKATQSRLSLEQTSLQQVIDNNQIPETSVEQLKLKSQVSAKLDEVVPTKTSQQEKQEKPVDKEGEPLDTTRSFSVTATAEQNKTSAKMSVSRRQLTPTELIAQKLTRAEQAVTNTDIVKAEQLFEEILIIEPEHKQARKKLAALWFGRQAYQQAINLLSQGIVIDRLDSEMRLMKAQIQLKQGQQEAAYNTLKPLASIEQEEYQVMLANIAQQIEQYDSAIKAYKVLIKMQPYSGRWHLGLAIVYDKNSQFSLALNEYKLALTKADLSASSTKFAQQRMQALGE